MSWWEATDGALAHVSAGLALTAIILLRSRPHRTIARSHLHDFTTFRTFEPRSPVALPCADGIHGKPLDDRFLASLSTLHALFPPRAPWPCSKALPPALPNLTSNSASPSFRPPALRCTFCDSAHAPQTLLQSGPVVAAQSLSRRCFARCFSVLPTTRCPLNEPHLVSLTSSFCDRSALNYCAIKLARRPAIAAWTLEQGRIDPNRQCNLCAGAQSRSQTTEHLLPPDICPTAALHNLGDITAPDWAIRRLSASIA